MSPPAAIAIGVMAFNEEANIARLLDSILAQSAIDRIRRIVVVASGCTDRTCEIVRAYSAQDERISLIEEPERGGKVLAINAFLAVASEPVLCISSADLIYERETIAELTAPFADDRIGMVGCHPIPLNSTDTFVGFTVNLMWQLHHEISLAHPKMGELIAFRNVFRGLDPRTLADEVQIEHGIRSVGYDIAYAPAAIVHNRGPETLAELIAQRTRWISFNVQIRSRHRLPVSTLDYGALLRTAIAHVHAQRPRRDWVAGAAILELYCRARAMMMHSGGDRPRQGLWVQQASTKVLVPDPLVPSPAESAEQRAGVA